MKTLLILILVNTSVIAQSLSLTINSVSHPEYVKGEVLSNSIKIDTVNTDSIMKCIPDTCYWIYNSHYDTTYLQHGKYWYKVDIIYSLFDANNRTFKLSPHILFSTIRTDYSFPIDSIYPDSITTSGTNMKTSVIFTATNAERINAVKLTCYLLTQISVSASDSYRYTTEITLDFPYLNASLNQSKKLNSEFKSNKRYLLNGRLIKNNFYNEIIMILNKIGQLER